MTPTLAKHSPLAALCRSSGGKMIDISGWQVADHFADPDKEKQHLSNASVLVDWSHIGKLTLRGSEAENEIAKKYPAAAELAPLQSYDSESGAVLRLTDDEFVILDPSGEVAEKKFDGSRVSVIDHSGTYACLVLAGPQRDEVILRSSAMNTRRDMFAPGTVIQTTVHGIGCIYYRTESLDMFLPVRDYGQSLYEAFLDVGRGVGLIPAGIATLPVNLK
jgi:heterotetrameric sarcosine oxidase gamma subunit